MPYLSDGNKCGNTREICLGEGSLLSISFEKGLPEHIIRVHVIKPFAPSHNGQVISTPASSAAIEIEEYNGPIFANMFIEHVAISVTDAPIQALNRKLLNLQTQPRAQSL